MCAFLCSVLSLQLNIKEGDWLRNSAYNPEHENILLIHGYAGGDNQLPTVVLRDGKIMMYCQCTRLVVSLSEFNHKQNVMPVKELFLNVTVSISGRHKQLPSTSDHTVLTLLLLRN